MTLNPKPGSFGLAVINGKVGKFIKWGQDIVERQDYLYTHAFFVLDNGEVIEAEPHGAQINSVSKYVDNPKVVFCDLPVKLALHDWTMAHGGYNQNGFPVNKGVYLVENRIRAGLVEYARKLKGVPYSYLDYVSLGLERFNVKLDFIERRVRRADHLICSQLVDYVYAQNNIHLFTDGRLPNDVTPGDLEHWIYEHVGRV